MQKKGIFALLPFALSLLIILADQLSKYWIVTHVKTGSIFLNLFSDFLWIVHVRNDAVGFSLGAGLPDALKSILFITVPLILIVLVCIYILRAREITTLQRWALAGIVGGGLGNVLDRMFREEWVVDFISVRVYGFLGFERWPTFNVADASIVVCAILLILSILLEMKGGRKEKIDEQEG